MKKINLIIFALLLTLAGANAQQLVHQWVQYAGGESLDLAVDMAIDKDNNLFVTGNFQDETYFGTTKLISEGSSDIFLAQYNQAGKLVWAKRMGGKSMEQVHSMQLDSKSNIYICGKYRGICNFNGKQLKASAYNENFVAKFNNRGSLLWVKSIKASTKGDKTLLAIDNEDNIYYAGSYYKSIELGTRKFSSSSSSDIFIAKLNDKGDFIDAISIGGQGQQKIKAIACGTKDQLFVTGLFNNEINFDAKSLKTNGKEDIFVAHLTKLKTSWVKQAGGYYNDFSTNIKVINEKVLVSGSFTEEALFNKTSLLSDGVLDAFVAAYDLNGDLQWAQKFGGLANEYVNSLLTSADGSVFISGSYRGKIQRKNSVLQSEQFSKDLYLTKLTKEGDFLWAESFGGSKQDFSVGLVKGNDDYFYLLGSYSQNLKIGKQKSHQLGKQDDFFISKFYDCGLSPKIDLGDDCTLCEGTTLEAKGDFVSYLWNTKSKESSIRITQGGIYSVTAIDKYGCQSSDEIKIDIAELPVVNLGPDIIAGTDETITLQTNEEFNSYLWSDGTQEKTLTLAPVKKDKTELISLSVTDENDCISTDEVLITRKAAFAEDNWNDLEGKKSNYQLYPNPTEGQFAIYVNKAAAVKQIDVFDVAGNRVKSYENIVSFPFRVDLSNQTKGTYLVIVSENTNAYQYKLIVK